MQEKSIAILSYSIVILFPLLYSLLKETRFTKKAAIVAYGLQMLAFTIGSFVIFDSSMNVLLLFSAIIGFVWTIIGLNREKSGSIFFSFKTLASWQIPVVLTGYKIWIWKTMDWPFVVTIGLLLIIFYAYSFNEKKKNNK